MVKPYFETENIKIYQDDNFKIIKSFPNQTISTIITDPPYCSGATEAAKRTKTPDKTPESIKEREVIQFDSMGSQGFMWTMRTWLLESRRVTIEGGHLACFIDWRMTPTLATIVEASGWRWNSLVVWDKGYPGLGHGFKSQHELIISASNGQPKWYSKTMGNVIKSTRLTQTEHPHQKPIDILRKIIDVCTKEGDTILDPYMGSGSTLIAAIQMKRKAIGIEISEEYCQKAVKRIKRETRQLTIT